MDGLLGGIGAVVLGLLGLFVLKKRASKDDLPGPRPVGPVESEARREALRLRQEEAVREKLKAVDSRPDTGDALADLEARLGTGPGAGGTSTEDGDG